MKNIKTAELKPGMVTTEPVKTKRGQELFPAGTALTKQLISRMEFYSIGSACIDETSILTEEERQTALQSVMAQTRSYSTPEVKSEEPRQEITSPQVQNTLPPGQGAPEQNIPTPPQRQNTFLQNTAASSQGQGTSVQSMAAPPQKQDTPVQNEVAYSQKIKLSKTFQEYSLNSCIVTKMLQDQLEGFVFEKKPMDFEAMLRAVKSLITPGQTVIQYFDMLHNLRSSDDSVYSHSLNVAMISLMLGKWLKWSSSDLDSLVIAGLLHDIGKITIPPEILNKEGKLTDEEFEQIRWHPRAGYELIGGLTIDSRIKKAALQHHERCDGSGYPMKQTGNMLDDFAMVIAIADVYDAMTSARKYRAPLCPFQVIREFESGGYQKYNTAYLLTFLRHIATTYQNNRVILSDGRAAKIILLNQNALSRPLVQLNDGSCIDLASSSLYIQSIV